MTPVRASEFDDAETGRVVLCSNLLARSHFSCDTDLSYPLAFCAEGPWAPKEVSCNQVYGQVMVKLGINIDVLQMRVTVFGSFDICIGGR